jgi:hypothetical protein
LEKAEKPESAHFLPKFQKSSLEYTSCSFECQEWRISLKMAKKIKNGKILKKLRIFEKSGEFLKKNENGEKNASLRRLANKKGRRRVASARKSQAA